MCPAPTYKIFSRSSAFLFDEVFLSVEIISLISFTDVVDVVVHCVINSWDCIVIENKCMIRLGWGAESTWLLPTFQSFMCKFQYNIIQSKLGHLTFSNREGNLGCNTLSPNDTGSLSPFPPSVSPNLVHHFLWKLCVLSWLLASGCFAFFLEVRWGFFFFFFFIWASFYLNKC